MPNIIINIPIYIYIYIYILYIYIYCTYIYCTCSEYLRSKVLSEGPSSSERNMSSKIFIFPSDFQTTYSSHIYCTVGEQTDRQLQIGRQTTDVIRLLCGSLRVKNDRLGNTGTLMGTSSACQNSFTNPIHHALLFCRKTENAQENCWSWITDHLPMSISYIFSSLDDHSFIQILLGDYSGTT